MNKWMLMVIFAVAALLTLTLNQGTSRALPEYSAQTGEPCATCHISPSGGGPRTLRGQAWVGAGKPGAVPDVATSLELLGVHLTINEAEFTTTPETIPPPAPLTKAPNALPVHPVLVNYNGN